MDYLYYVFAILTFIAVVLLIEGLYLVWNSSRGPEAERVARRLRIMSAGAHGDTGSSMIKKRLLSDTPALQRLLLSVPRVHALDRLLEQSGLTWSVASFAGVMLATAGAAFLLLSYFSVPWALRLPLAYATIAAAYALAASLVYRHVRVPTAAAV